MFAILNTRNEVIGYTSVDAREVEIAGAIAADGTPVNVNSYRISKSKANCAKLCAEMPSLVAHQFRGRSFYTLEA